MNEYLCIKTLKMVDDDEIAVKMGEKYLGEPTGDGYFELGTAVADFHLFSKKDMKKHFREMPNREKTLTLSIESLIDSAFAEYLESDTPSDAPEFWGAVEDSENGTKDISYTFENDDDTTIKMTIKT